MKINTALIIYIILAIAANLGYLYGIYKCFQMGNYPLGVILTIIYLVWKIVGTRNK